MKNTTYIALAIIIFGTSLTCVAQTDLTMREALYFTGSKTTINLSKDKFVVKGATINLPTELAKSCQQNTCDFNVGFIGFRNGSTETELSTYALISVENAGLVGNTLLFTAGEKSKQGVHPVKLSLGLNKVTFTIDPYEKTAESSESNNTFTVTVVVGRRVGEKGLIKTQSPRTGGKP